MKKLFVYLLLVIAAITLVSCSTQTAKVQDFIGIEYSPAYNEYAKPKLVIDTDGLNALMDSKKTLNYVKSLMNHSDEEYKGLVDEVMAALEKDPDMLPGFTDFFAIDFVENYDGLKNGDIVKAKITLNGENNSKASVQDVAKKLGLKLSKTEIEFKVEGLEDLSVIDVDLDKLLKVDFGKYNGFASPSLEIDYDYFRGLLIDKVVDHFAQESKNDEVKEKLARDCKEWFTAEFDEAYDGLRNGDKIKVQLVLDKAFTDCGISIADFEAGLALNLKGGNNVYEVKDLAEPENVLDIFEGIEQYIVYEGANGNISIGYGNINIPQDYSRQVGDLYFSKGTYTNSVKIVYNNTKIGEIYYSISGTKLNKGDVIEMTADCPVNAIEALGYIIPSTRKNTTVPDCGDYLTSQDQLTPDVIAAIKAIICEKREIEAESIDKLYLGTFKPGVECSYNSTAFIEVVFHKSGWFRGYYVDELYDIIIKPDGTISQGDYVKDGWPEDTLEIVLDQLNHSEKFNYSEIN